jgi:regulator of sigma E protease
MNTAVFDFIIPFIVVLGILVFIHELGHYLAAKIFGMKVDAFSLGFPPRAWGFRWATRKLRPKFMRDIRRAIGSHAVFKQLDEIIQRNKLSSSAEESITLLARIFSIEQESTSKTVTNAKGNSEEKIAVLTKVVANENEISAIPQDMIPVLRDTFAGSRDLVEYFLRYQEIQSESIFKKSYETDYCVSWIPLGGYCKINGMVDESLDLENMQEGSPLPWEYRAKPVWQRLIVITGGVFFNFILAAVVFTIMAMRSGLPDVDKYKDYQLTLGTQISAVNPGSPAESAGMKSGDRIVAINHQPVREWSKLVDLIHDKPGQKILVEWTRGDERLSSEIVPNRVKIRTADGEKEIGQIGIGAPPMPDFYMDATFAESVKFGFENTFYMSAFMVRSIKQIMTGEQSFRDAMGGPIAIVRMTGEVKQQRGWEGIWNFMALLSISLAVFNLFPIPALDGGHVVMLVIEAVIRRPLSLRFKLRAQQIGMAILLTFIAFVFFNDIMKIFTGK